MSDFDKISALKAHLEAINSYINDNNIQKSYHIHSLISYLQDNCQKWLSIYHENNERVESQAMDVSSFVGLAELLIRQRVLTPLQLIDNTLNDPNVWTAIQCIQPLSSLPRRYAHRERGQASDPRKTHFTGIDVRFSQTQVGSFFQKGGDRPANLADCTIASAARRCQVRRGDGEWELPPIRVIPSNPDGILRSSEPFLTLNNKGLAARAIAGVPVTYWVPALLFDGSEKKTIERIRTQMHPQPILFGHTTVQVGSNPNHRVSIHIPQRLPKPDEIEKLHKEEASDASSNGTLAKRLEKQYKEVSRPSVIPSK